VHQSARELHLSNERVRGGASRSTVYCGAGKSDGGALAVVSETNAVSVSITAVAMLALHHQNGLSCVVMHQFSRGGADNSNFHTQKKTGGGPQVLWWWRWEAQGPRSLVDRGRMFLGLPDFVL
jgi:hypothetical protein